MGKHKQKKDKSQYLADGSNYLFSLNKFTGKKVIDVLGYPSNPFGGCPVFVVTRIKFEDGTSLHMEGEHDTAYLPSEEGLQNMDEDALQSFIEE